MRAFLAGLSLLIAVPALAEGRAATPFTLKDIGGQSVDVGAFLGKDVVLVNFFATWCAPCQAELPILQKLHEAHAKDGLRIVVVSIDDPKSSAKVKSLVKENGFTFTVLLDTQTKVVSLYNPKKAVPFSVIVDRSGSVVSEKFGFQPGDAEKLEAELKGLLAAGVPSAPASAPTPAKE